MALNFRNRNKASAPENKQIFSYYKGDSNTKNSNLNTSTKTRRFHNLPYYISILIMIFCVAYAMTLSNNSSVKIVNQDNESLEQLNINVNEYQNLISAKLSNSLMNQTKLTIDTAKIEDELKTVITEATDIAISLPIISRNPVVYIRIAEPVATLKTNDNKVFLIDEKGRAVKAVDQPTSDYLQIKDTSGLIISEGKQALPAKQLQFMQNVDKQLQRNKIVATEFTYSINANEILVKLKDKKYYAKFNLAGDARLQSGALIATIKELSKKATEPSTYIDVRVEERAYYK